MRTDEDAYADIAAFYEAEFGAIETDVQYYAREGGRGPLLVLGCGTGRVGRMLASQRSVLGLDRSESMLAIARARSPLATYVLGDMRSFELGVFSEIIVPNGAFNFLATRDDQARCLECCSRALRSGDRMIIDMPMPDFSLIGIPHTPEKTAWEGRVGDGDGRRTREVERHPVAGRLLLTDRYYLDGQLVATSNLRLRWVFPAEVEWMLEANGFFVDANHGDYTGRPVREGCPRLLVHAIRL